MKKYTLIFGTIAAAAMFFTSCNSGSNGGVGGGGAAGPARSASFVGASVSFNPTLTFTADGVLTYVNDDPASPFTLASTPIPGTYTYVPSSNFQTGVMTYTIGDETVSATFSNFVVVEGNVTGWTVQVPGLSSYFATANGQIAAAVINSGGGGGTPGGPPSGGENFTFQTNGNIANGTTFSKVYLAGNTQGNVSASPLANFSNGQSVGFSISGSGAIEFPGKSGTISVPFTAATGDGKLQWSGPSTGNGTIFVNFDTAATAAPSDLQIIWNGPIDFTNPSAVAIDGKTFAN